MSDFQRLQTLEFERPPTRSECQTFLQAMYKEQCDQARQHEAMRQQATTIVLTLAGVVVSLAAASGGALAFLRGNSGFKYGDAVLLAVYSLLGVFVVGVARHGQRLSLKHYDVNREHIARARNYRLLIEENIFPGKGYSNSRSVIATDNEKERLHVLWKDIFKFLIRVGYLMIAVPLMGAALISPYIRERLLGLWASMVN